MIIPVFILSAAGLKKSKLLNIQWVNNPGGYENYTIEFKTNGRADYSYRGYEAGSQYLYQYIVVGNKVILTKPKHIKMDILEPPKRIECSLVQDTTSLHIMEKLVCNGKKLIFNNTTKKVPSGTPREVEGTSVIVWNKKMTTTWNLIIRTKPSIKSKKKFYHIAKNNDQTLVLQKSLPKGKKVYALARTISKMKVGKWNNYWYYISYENAEMGRHGAEAKAENGWVFGEFLK